MHYPKLRGRQTRRDSIDSFSGYVHRLRIRDGELYETKDLSGDAWPLLSTRARRGKVATLTAPAGLIAKDAPCYVAGGTLYVNHLATSVTGLTEGEKQLVSMGAYLVIFPDKVWYNTQDPSDTGSLEASYASLGSVRYVPCDVFGEPYTIAHTGSSEPTDPAGGDIWVDESEGTVYRQWSAADGIWVEIPTVYTKICFTSRGEIPRLFRQYDGVTISGSQKDELNGEKILYAVGGDTDSDDFAVVVGLLEAAYTDEGSGIRLERRVPDLDYVCECQNRLWGCRYGIREGRTVNAIYASALGDPRNFFQFLGLSTDSWAASVGSDGPWTGAVSYLGRPCFFKEERIHTVTVSASGAHRLDETVCRGVQKGSWKSLQVVGETLLYKSRTDICAWQGGFPQSVSEQLGDVLYYQAVAGSVGEKYYVSMRDGKGAWSLFTYDRVKKLWYREDGLHALAFAACDDSLYCIDAGSGELLDLLGAVGTPESGIHWSCETGIQGWRWPDRKYLSRYDFTLRLEQDASLQAKIEYDSSGIWEDAGSIRGGGMGTRVLPVRPRRCDHLRIRLEGEGEMQLFSIARILEIGSDR